MSWLLLVGIYILYKKTLLCQRGIVLSEEDFGYKLFDFRMKTGINLEELREYSNTFEGALQEKIRKFNAKYERRVKNIPFEEMDDYIEYVYFYEGGYELQNRFPELFRNSLFTTCYSSFEVELMNFCKFIKIEKNIKLNLFDLKVEGIFKAQMYLKKVANYPFPDEKTPEWGQIICYNAIRNSIVHNNNIINSDRNKNVEQELRDFAKKSTHFNISLENKIELKQDFSLVFLSTIESFLDQLYAPFIKSRNPFDK